ncbi:MAG: GIY-YIG nuclease family protein [Gemmatimonadetes bacterium]|nr:GIY-YIG nuclease family protein [Gemmatimonadota bacterium]HNV77798.1 GIY-YIG nuclease family protein [Gemmatimonadaceae bacterium]MBK6457350.1 GIY-YIG nuclease family protein [Gemmatimonadota bacterium]MBK6842560.1 GIY-YIG nuclease family protein [Gemmatimonadota bacterium]MBK7830968.1 GIY-YIG nuclease family protein [Gemmatimonadota bacterium]
MTLDRKALTRQYKETPRTAGVALAKNLANGKCFLFAGVDIAALVNRHRAQLKLGGHPNKVLQGDWNALGADQFAFEVVDTLPVPETADVDQRDDVAALEALWLEKLAPFEPAGYNRAPRPRG